MSPVHVIVGEDQRAEAMWAGAFAGAVDLYRFPRNADAFERLTAAEAPVDLIILTPAQRGPFNLTPDQFVARVLEGPLATSAHLANLHVIVVGSGLTRSHPRAASVSTLDAAIRLVKFGQIEQAPKPVAPAAAAIAPVIGTVTDIDSILADEGAFSSSIISRIWDAGDADAKSRAAQAAPAVAPESRRDVSGGGAQAPQRRNAAVRRNIPVALSQPMAPAEPVLFARAAPAGFVIAPGMVETARQIRGGGPTAASQVGAPGESIQVATGALQPARAYTLQNGGGYRGPDLRGGHVNAATHHAVAGGAPVPPALASQVNAMVYGSAQGGVADPLLVWSSSSRGQIVASGVPLPGAAGGMPAPMPAPAPAPASVRVPRATAPIAPQVAVQLRTVPMHPPAGVYPGSAAQGAPRVANPAPIANHVASRQASDPFLARAEQGVGDVSFG